MVGRLGGARVTGAVVACAVGTTVGEGDGAGDGEGDGEGGDIDDEEDGGDVSTDVAEGELVDGAMDGGGVLTWSAVQAGMNVTAKSPNIKDRMLPPTLAITETRSLGPEPPPVVHSISCWERARSSHRSETEQEGRVAAWQQALERRRRWADQRRHRHRSRGRRWYASTVGAVLSHEGGLER